MWAVAKKDFKSIFFSPICYIVVALFLAAMGIIMYLLTISIRAIDFNKTYEYMAKFVLPIVVGLLTMKAFSEEKSNDTEKLIFTASKKTTEIIIGKILAVFMVILVSVIFSFLYCLMFSK